MARNLSPDDVVAAIGRINYPGYTSDLLSLGILEEVTPKDDGGFTVMIRHAGDKEATLKQIAGRIHEVLTHDLGVRNIDFKVHKIDPELGAKASRARLPGTRWVVAVASGKGGVGKSTVAANLAVALSRMDYKVGLLDADIYGPSVPMMFGITEEKPRSAGGQNFFPIEKHGIKLISMGFFVTDKTPIIWRGPMVMSAVRQFLMDTLWGTQDFLIVDLPPGTGDAQLTLAQQVALDGVVIVTTPQDVALADAMRAIKMFRQVHCPLLGVVENMSYFVCPDCGEREELFGHGGGAKMGEAEGMKLLAEIPVEVAVRETGDAGTPITLSHPDDPSSRAFAELARQVADAMPQA
ncbi:MAG TPA: Mrp/NBP35 family ATP-binding protein [Candidatus Binataceae bacterium]|nr:Mrp/NBP35 family ATP-binding protein [Candidatus Binataceae bacterium]